MLSTSQAESTVAASAVSLLCPACGRAGAHQLRFHRNGCDILQCASCGLGRAQASAFDPGSYYNEGYFSGGHCDGYADYLGAEPVLRREFARTVDFIRGLRPGGKLLEIGCAYGFFLQEAARHYQVAGIELAAEAAAHCRRSGLNVLHGEADLENLRRIGPVDVIVLLDVIEHLPQPQETLALCRQQLNPGGIVVITTGDFASLAARIAGARWRLMTPPQHLWFFTPESMRRLSAGLGLSLAHLDHPWKVVPLSLITFQLRRMLGMGAGGATPTGYASAIGVPVNLFDAMRIVLRSAS